MVEAAITWEYIEYQGYWVFKEKITCFQISRKLKIRDNSFHKKDYKFNDPCFLRKPVRSCNEQH